MTIITGLTAREIRRWCPRVERQLWGGELWADGCFARTVGRRGDARTIGDDVQKQGGAYRQRHEDRQLALS